MDKWKHSIIKILSSGIQKAIEMTIDLGIFGFCGLENVRQEFFYQVIEGDDALRQGYLDKAFALGADW